MSWPLVTATWTTSGAAAALLPPPLPPPLPLSAAAASRPLLPSCAVQAVSSALAWLSQPPVSLSVSR